MVAQDAWVGVRPPAQAAAARGWASPESQRGADPECDFTHGKHRKCQEVSSEESWTDGGGQTERVLPGPGRRRTEAGSDHRRF